MNNGPRQMDMPLTFPSAVLISKPALPLDKVVGGLGAILELTIAGANNALDGAALLEVLLDTLLLELVGLDLFGRELARSTTGLECGVASPDVLDVIVNTLEAFVALEELVGLLGVVEMGKAFPLDVEPLQRCE